ncbi:MAG: choice-of-anchor P family protein [Sphingomicrobium sp.]
MLNCACEPLLPVSDGAQATATINNLALGIGSVSFLPSLFNISATTIQSFSQANTIGGFDASGTTTIEGLVLSGSALGALVFDGNLLVNPAPNTILFSGGGLSIILNEQILSASGITTNAINIGFTNFLLGTGLQNGNIIFAQTQASAVAGVNGAVPEPATWAMMLIGFGAVGVSMRRRKKLQGLLQAA